MLKTIKGVVIGTTPFKENSKILNILTIDGIIGVVSKGCKNLKSPLRIISDKLMYSEYTIYYKENGLSTLKEGAVINDLKSIKSSLTGISYLSYISELTSQVIKQNEDPNIYNLYIKTILKMNELGSYKILTNILEIKLLDYLGVPINLCSCSKCGDTEHIVTIDGSFGGYLCANCRVNEPIYSEKVIKMLRLYYLVEIDSLKELKISDDVENTINDFLDMYYETYTGLYLNSKKLLDINI